MTGFLDAVLSHLWQSTAFASVAALATLGFRSNRAAVRHAIWLAASAKFLVPFAALVAIGPFLPVRVPSPPAGRRTIIVIEAVGQALSHGDPSASRAPASLAPSSSARDGLSRALPMLAVGVWLAGALATLAAWARRWRRVADIARRADAVHDGAAFDALQQIAGASGVLRPIALVATDEPLEPGVFGIRRPVLLWPRRIADHLDDDQIAAVLTHEVAHVRRRDNLASVLHMAVEALFWFHPLVWWIGARLIDERERACDEAVIHECGSPERYAETILQACRVFVESPLPCVAGVTGSDLQARIRRIMSGGRVAPLSAAKKFALAALATVAVAAPIVVGAAAPRRPRIEATITSAHLLVAGTQPLPAFEVASVRPIRSSVTKTSIATQEGGRFTATNVTLRQLIRFAYHLQESQISGGPAWLADDRFDIVAKADGTLDDAFEGEKEDAVNRVQLMLRSLLADRFKLAVHVDSTEQPIYALTVARSDGALGPRLKPSVRDCTAAKRGDPPVVGTAMILSDTPTCGMRVLPGTIVAGGVRLSQLADTLSPLVGRLVQDATGLAGDFEFVLHWTPDQIPQGYDRKASAMGLAPIDPDGPSLMTAVREQLGLKFDARKGAVDILIVDRAERPTEN